jgi:hypothetical protein
MINKSTKNFLLQSSVWMLLIPLIISAFTHLWNPIGFLTTNSDESTYMRRAMNVLNGFGPLKPISPITPTIGNIYDHPFFGQTFLASLLWIVGYPNSIHPTIGDVHSIEMLWLVPRLWMGILAVVDTFLVYKISEIRYGRNVAFIASIIFASMPMTLFLRRMWLEPIELPFILLSILFAVYYTNKKDSRSGIKNYDNDSKNNRKKIAMTMFSGIALGLAIFTKIPAFTMIPLVSLLIYNNNKNLKALGLWFVPVILIPLIWPAFSIAIGQYSSWLEGVHEQANRWDLSVVIEEAKIDFNIDPAILVIGGIGIVFAAALKRDLLPILWVIPFVIFIYYIGWYQYFHLIPILPALSIASAILIVDLSNRINSRLKKSKHKILSKSLLLPLLIISGIGIFEIINYNLVYGNNILWWTTANDASPYIKSTSFVSQYLHNINNNSSNNNNSNITVISTAYYSWIPKEVFHLNESYGGYDYITMFKPPKVMFIIDNEFMIDVNEVGIPLDEEYLNKGIAYFEPVNKENYDANLGVNITESYLRPEIKPGATNS